MAAVLQAQMDGRPRQRGQALPEIEFRMQWPEVERFLADWGRQDHSAEGVERYRFCLRKFYYFLPENHLVRRDTVRQWRERLLQAGYAPATVNLYISACNTWLEYIGRREFQVLGQLDSASNYRASLDREDYFRLLLAARAQGHEKLFLIIKVFGTTGLYANELGNVTVEAVESGWLSSRETGGMRRAQLPEGLRKELLAYAQREGIASGPLFRTRDGSAVARTTVACQIRNLGREAGITDGKATASGLRLMYLANRAEIEADVALLVEQTLERQATQEQLIVGWAT